jgi:hypothetical protein
MKKLETSTIGLISLPIFFFILSVLIIKSCNKNLRLDLIEYYQKTNITLIGKIIKINYLEKDMCILNVCIQKSNTINHVGKMATFPYTDIIIKKDSAKVFSSYSRKIKINDSLVIELNKGIFKIYRKDSLILDEGFKYYKNGKVTAE